jgi:DNA-binding MarR family transcriptional regulator
MIERNRKSIPAILTHNGHKMHLMLDKIFQSNQCDINLEQFVILLLLGKNNAYSQQEISNMLDKDKTTITRLLSKMEKKNLILRIPSRTDKRVNNTYATNYGKETLERIWPIINSVQEKLENSVDDKELKVFNTVMEKFSKTMIEIVNKL